MGWIPSGIRKCSYIWFILMLQGCSQSPVYLAFDNQIPDTVPRIFAEHLIGKRDAYAGYCTFNSAEQVVCYAITNQEWNTSHIVKLSADGQLETLSLGVNRNWEGEPMFTPGGSINTPGWEMGPSLSPDGQYLFFTRRRSWDTEEPSNIFWVDISIIEQFR